jgi:hypothetical protein
LVHFLRDVADPAVEQLPHCNSLVRNWQRRNPAIPRCEIQHWRATASRRSARAKVFGSGKIADLNSKMPLDDQSCAVLAGLLG